MKGRGAAYRRMLFPRPRDLRETLKHIKERIAVLGADSFFMVHNQYYVYSTPSAVDRKLAAVLGKAPGIKGHIVLNPCYFGLITIKGIAILRVLPDIGSPLCRSCYRHPSKLSGALDYPVLTIDHWAKALTRRKRPVLIPYATTQFFANCRKSASTR